MAKTKKIPSKIPLRLENFFELVKPDEFRNQLIEMFHSYILHEHESLPYDFRHVVEGMMIFFDFLKFAQEEYDKQSSRNT